MAKISTMVIVLNNRVDTAPKVQSILTNHGCNIKARLGLHEGTEDKCTNYGVIFLQLAGDEESHNALEKELNEVPGTKAKLVQIDLE
jgi:hypothetical protein